MALPISSTYRFKHVDFEKYCPLCKHQKKDGNSEPCDECLNVPARQYSHKPEKFVPKK